MSQGRSSWQPRRWSDAKSDAPEALRVALQDARDTTLESVNSERVVRLAERVGVGGGVAVGVALSTTGATVGGAGVGGAGGVSAIVAYKLWVYLSGVVAVSAVALVIWSALAVDDSVDRRAAGALALPEDVATVVDHPVHSHPIARPLTASADVTALAPLADAVQPAARTASRRKQASTDATSVAASVAVPAKLDAAAELTILNQAQDALTQAPRRALSLAGDHARAFPRGVFAQEREVIAIEALIKLQRSDEATARGRAFLSTFPTSTHAPRVQHMLGE